MTRLSDVDYATQGLSIRRAFVNAKETAGPIPKPLREPLSIRWGTHDIVTADIFEVPPTGRVRLEFLEIDSAARQGADIQVAPGCKLQDGSLVPLLRTWYEEGLPATVEYEFAAEDRLMRTYNVYEVLQSDESRAEHWTENAGMWIEELGDLDRIYHCSHGIPETPAVFEALVYRLTVG